MHKSRECEEVATLDGVAYKFAGTFGFIERLAIKGRDPAYIYDDLSSGLLPPIHIKNALSCSLEAVDGVDILEGQDDVIVSFIEAAGLQESSMVARVLMSHAMIGSVKKKQIRLDEELKGLEMKTRNFLSTNLGKVGLSLAVISLILVALACMNFNAFEMFSI